MPKKDSESDRMTTLLYLTKLGAGPSFSSISSGDLGESMGLSQQAASLRLIELERAGLVERAHHGRGLQVRLTSHGLKSVSSFYGGLKDTLEKVPSELQFQGTLFTGLREGGYYVSLDGYAKPFRESLGFVPFPGTMNLRLSDPRTISQRRMLNSLPGIEVKGFADGKRTFGPVKCFRAKVEGKHPGGVLAIERTHYDETVIEVISPVNLRKVLKLEDGDECSVTVYLR